jgi:hypothetical protein
MKPRCRATIVGGGRERMEGKKKKNKGGRKKGELGKKQIFCSGQRDSNRDILSNFPSDVYVFHTN